MTVKKKTPRHVLKKSKPLVSMASQGCCAFADRPWNVGKVHLLHTPTPGEDLTKVYFPLGDPVKAFGAKFEAGSIDVTAPTKPSSGERRKELIVRDTLTPAEQTARSAEIASKGDAGEIAKLRGFEVPTMDEAGTVEMKPYDDVDRALLALRVDADVPEKPQVVVREIGKFDSTDAFRATVIVIVFVLFGIVWLIWSYVK